MRGRERESECSVECGGSGDPVVVVVAGCAALRGWCRSAVVINNCKKLSDFFVLPGFGGVHNEKEAYAFGRFCSYCFCFHSHDLLPGPTHIPHPTRHGCNEMNSSGTMANTTVPMLSLSVSAMPKTDFSET